MPIYTYDCLKCGFRFEKLVSMSYQALPPCPLCGSINTEKMVSKPADRPDMTMREF